MKPPQRHYELAIRVGADSIPDLVASLKNITHDIVMTGHIECTSGGSNSNYRAYMRVNDIDHAEYFRQVEDFLAYLEE